MPFFFAAKFFSALLELTQPCLPFTTTKADSPIAWVPPSTPSVERQPRLQSIFKAFVAQCTHLPCQHTFKPRDYHVGIRYFLTTFKHVGATLTISTARVRPLCMHLRFGRCRPAFDLFDICDTPSTPLDQGCPRTQALTPVKSRVYNICTRARLHGGPYLFELHTSGS